MTLLRTFAVLVVVLGACSGPTRTPISETEIAQAKPYGIPGLLRVWGDGLDGITKAGIREALLVRARAMHNEALELGAPITETALALSGGGADGAFGAGVLAGWTEKGDRPKFDIVSGVSTGAIIGLFAFLGPEYDDDLRELYTAYSTADLLEPALFSGLFGGTSISDTDAYNRLIDRYVNQDVIAALAQEGAKGRVLLIGTTNLDAARPVIWNATAIAQSGHPQAITLVRDLIRASSAIPAVFPPVVVPMVTQDGRSFDELHVDGGTTQQVMLFSAELPISEIDRALGRKIDRTVYVIMNNSLEKRYEPVDLGILPIAGKAVSSLIGGSGVGDIYKIYAITQRDEIDLRLLWVPRSFEQVPEEPFDRAYMQALYALGRDLGRGGVDWAEQPPNFTISEGVGDD
ncbi:MAG: patatin-like phospholipase family protein [Pseudomonadota bacterium]